MEHIFLNRVAAGRALARHLQSYAQRQDVIVLALPRGGVPVGFEVAAALRALRSRSPARIVVALPVAPPDGELRLGDATDEFVCALTPRIFFSVGQFYQDFGETTDEDVRGLLAGSAAGPAGSFKPPQP